MTLVAPIRPRASFRDTSEGLEITVPARRNTFLTLFLGLWLCGWVVGEIMVPASFLRGGTHHGPVLVGAVWLVAWTFGGGCALYAFWWSLIGHERILISSLRLSIKRELFGRGRVREYDKAHVRDLRVSPNPYNPFDFRSSLQFWGVGGGILAFDYGAATVRFGAGVDESEAKSIVAQVKARGFHDAA